MSNVIQWDGNIITEPGIYKGVPMDLYHSAELFDGVPAISSSGLRAIFNKSAAHYWAESPYNPNRVEPEDKPHFTLGRALHHLVSGEGGFQQHFAAQPEEYEDSKTGEMKPWNGNATVCRDWKAAQIERGATILTPTQIEHLKGMAISLGRHPLVKQGILRGQIEYSYFWRDPETGIWLKWRPDNTPNDSADFVDLKTTTDVTSWIKLQRTIHDFGYHQQGALGAEASRALLGREMESFHLFFIEKMRPPYDCRLVQLKDHDLKLGSRMNRAALRTFWTCWKNKDWPGAAENHVEHIEIDSRSYEYTEARLQAEGV